MSRRLKRDFFARKPEIVARDLLGKILVSKLDGYRLTGMIVEVEAYLSNDEASHAFKGPNSRNQSLYKKGGHLYVHTARHHTMMDIVTDSRDVPGSVLIRAVEPLEGLEIMRQKRGRQKIEDLMSGPGKVGEALGITKALDGIDITKKDAVLYVEEGTTIPMKRVGVSGRIGISKAKTAPLRFYVSDNPHVSQPWGTKRVGLA